MIRHSARSLLLASAGLCLVPSAAADFTQPAAPAWRGQPFTEFAAWNQFTHAVTAPNLPDDPTSNALDATLVQLDPSAFLVAGNIYSFSAPLRCVLSNSVPGATAELWLQVATRGSELDYDAVRIEFLDLAGSLQSRGFDHRVELARTPIANGVAVETLFRFDLAQPGLAIRAFELRFEAAAASASLDALILDVLHAAPPTVYCMAKVNSLGCTPAIESSGDASASANSGFTLRARELRNQKAGVLLYTVGGRAATAFQGGTLCLGGALKRVQGLQSGGSALPIQDCSGLLSVDMNAFRAGLLGGNPQPFLSQPGSVVDAQFWARDPGFAAPFNSQLTDALEFTVLN